MRVAFLSLHSHGDRSFLDDNALALAAGQARRRGVDAALVVVALDGGVADPTTAAAFGRLVDVLAGFDVVVYQRTWTRAIPAALVAALPAATVVHWRGEHVLDDPPGRYQAEGRALPDLLAYLAGDRPTVPVGAQARVDGGWRAGLGALTVAADAAFVPDLRPIVVNPEALPAERVLSLDGNPGCPYQADARANPAYAGVELPAGVGRGCGFCTTGNHYQARPQRALVAELVAQLTYVRREAPDLRRIVLRDQNPFGYLAELMEACAEAGVGGVTLLLQTRADWLVAGERRFLRALDAAARAGITVTPFLVGIESFSQAELDRMNKGVAVADNHALLAALRRWAGHPAFDLAGASFGFILFTPWTTMADLEAAYAGIVATDFDRLRGRILTARVRLYPDTAMYYLAARDGLLADGGGATGQPGRYGYFPDHAWRFADPTVARFAELAASASDATGGRDERRVFRALLDAFAAAPAAAVTLADVLAGVTAPPVANPTAPTPAVPAGRAAAPTSRRRRVELDGGRGCGRPRCAMCSPATGATIDPATLRGGGERLVLRGLGAGWPGLGPLVAAARRAGFADVVAAGHPGGLGELSEIRTIAAAGVDAVLVPVASQVAVVHDKVTGVDGDLVATLVAVRALAAAGVAVELEVPVVAARLQDLVAVVELFARAVPTVRAIRFGLPRHPLPRALAPPPVAELGARLDAAIAAATARGIAAPLEVTAAVPLCAVVDHPAARAAVRFDPRRATRVSGCRQPPACAGCAAAAQCPGLTPAYLAAHGAAGARPLTERPAALYQQRTTPLRVWDDAARAAARQAQLLVLRPTVHCNQDCGFCSANESTPNVWSDPARMVREIARAARRGVERVSFSGGEPTLARELPRYIRVARRAGVGKVELVTNGVLLDRAAKVAALVDAGLTHAFVSLHGHDEASASAATRKAGDFARTVAAIGHLIEAGVITVVNHVIHAGNAHLLVRFVEEIYARFGGRTMISFAFVTPQYKALDHLAMVPRLSAVAPVLQAAAWRALALGQPFVIGSRQGVPPCFLGPFVAWSDVMQLAHEAQAEDAPQKQHGPRCGACRFARYCTGVWRPYAARDGFDELVPIAGPPLGPDERAALLRHARRPPWGQPMAFADVHPLLRDLAAEAAGPPVLAPARPPPPVVVTGQRPLRLLMVGSGARARLLAQAAHGTGAWAVAAVCSPHADAVDRAGFGGAPAYADLALALDETRPDAVLVASATPSHVAVAQRALAAGVPVLIEKPMAGSIAEAAALAVQAAEAGALLMPAHNLRFAPGLAQALAAASGRPLAVARHTAARSVEALHAWHRAPLFEGLYHLMVLAHVHGGDQLAVGDAAWSGDDRPGWIRIALASPGGAVDVTWSLTAPTDALAVTAPGVAWRRAGPLHELVIDGVVQPVEPAGGELARMLIAFHRAVRTGGPTPVPATDGAAVMALTTAACDALAAAGAPLTRSTAPRHAASPALAPRYR
ncbi:MAG: radical SAM protein [Kofleriaceae bacterium]